MVLHLVLMCVLHGLELLGGDVVLPVLQTFVCCLLFCTACGGAFCTACTACTATPAGTPQVSELVHTPTQSVKYTPKGEQYKQYRQYGSITTLPTPDQIQRTALCLILLNGCKSAAAAAALNDIPTDDDHKHCSSTWEAPTSWGLAALQKLRWVLFHSAPGGTQGEFVACSCLERSLKLEHR